MKNYRKALISLLVAYVLILAGWAPPVLAQQGTAASYVAGERNVAWYNFGKGSVQGAYITSGNTATGSQTITVCPAFRPLPDGRVVNLFGGPGLASVPITVDAQSSTNVETVTPTAVALTTPQQLQGSNQAVSCAQITASFSFTHAPSQNTHQVISGDGGVQEAINDAAPAGGGVVTVGADSAGFVTNAILAAAVPYANVSIADKRAALQYWNPAPTTTTTITAPTTLTATTVGFGLNGANTTGGTYTGASTYHVAVACVDVMGNESQPSADFSGLTAGTGTTNQIGIAAPAAQTGCVGWVPYISLAGGSYALAYRVPVATYSNGVPTANGVCALTQIETITAACKITNSTYNQTGVAAIVSALTVNTARIWVGVGGTSSTSDVVGNSSARTTYAYAPGARLAIGNVQTYNAFAAATAPATTVPAIVGTIHLPPGYMNFVGRSIRICGTIQGGGASTATVENVAFYWDADGSNATGAGVLLSGPTLTSTLTGTPAIQFCQTLTTTVSGSGATAGSILSTQGHITIANGAGGTAGVTTMTQPGSAVASLNLAQEARIDIDYLHTTGTDGTETLKNLTVEAIN
jgi:hypothetical protein